MIIVNASAETEEKRNGSFHIEVDENFNGGLQKFGIKPRIETKRHRDGKRWFASCENISWEADLSTGLRQTGTFLTIASDPDKARKTCEEMISKAYNSVTEACVPMKPLKIRLVIDQSIKPHLQL